MWDILLTTLKFLGLIVSGVAGYIAAVPEPKNETSPKPTPHYWLGRKIGMLLSKEWALRWVVIGLAVALLSQFAESIKSAQDAHEAREKDREQMHQLERVFTRFHSLSVSVQFTLSLTNPVFSTLRYDLLRAFTNASSFADVPAQELFISTNYPRYIEIDAAKFSAKVEGQIFTPDETTRTLLNLVKRPKLYFAVDKKRSEPDSFSLFLIHVPESLKGAPIFGSFDARSCAKSLVFDPMRDKLFIKWEQRVADLGDFRQSVQTLSLSDLLPAEIWVAMTADATSPSPEVMLIHALEPVAGVLRFDDIPVDIPLRKKLGSSVMPVSGDCVIFNAQLYIRE